MVQVGPDPRRWKALALLCGAFFMVILDSAIVVVALPSLEADLGFAPSDLQWVLSAYALSFGGLLLLGGRSSDLLGRRRMFMVGLVLFTVASLLCGLAWSPAALIAARSFQGVGAAVLTPTALSIVMTTFEEGAERNKALGIWGSLGGIGGTAGWLIGGPLTDISWEWVFLINVPIGVLALALAPRLLSESRATQQRRGFDPLGALSATAALVLLVYAVVEAPEAGWSDPQTIGLLAGSAALFVLFAVIESRVAQPLLPLRIFRSWTLVGANATMVLFSSVAFGMPFLLTLYAQQVLGFSPVRFGLTSVVFPVSVAVAAIVGQGLVLKLGFRVVASAGLVLLGVGCLYFTQVSADGSYFGDIFLGLLVSGLGVGFTFVTVSIAALAGVGEREAGVASGLSNTTFQIGAAVGVAIVSTVAVSRTNDVIGAGGDPVGALVEGHQAGFLATAVLAGIGLLAALLLLRRPPTATPEEHPPLVPVAEHTD
ncbi:DHA2 family efflux MFS transporter permease subunit [Jiangella ureilytica]|uniref:DHA2 family efflux MFS transporter permease subunit n=1 Tax=Jiangella ureilytica TaxID=2530374 RepID=A0A4R4RF60_9ACTN|nr:MFS transporter [Jiangella ureilytica]TDC47927.1 DHA2 family efflux MFS transporter permease subunit [Jiangella ureilytica]